MPPFLIIPRTAQATALVVACFFPALVAAINIGEIESQSKLGEPLAIQVGLQLGPNEIITNSCLSLAPPDSDEEDVQYYLVSPKLSVSTEAGRQWITIHSYKAFTEAFAKLKLRISCPGMGSVTKTLIFLPDMNPVETAMAATNTALPSPSASETPAPNISLALSPAFSSKAPQNTTQNSSRPRARHSASKRSTVTSLGKKSNRARTFTLKLSSEPMDESRIGKISPKEREALLARQKLLDADDQMASFLTLQNQVKLLQDELGEIKLKLTQLSASSHPATVTIANIKENSLPLPDAKQNRVMVSIGLVLSILALWFGLRFYNRVKSQHLSEQVWEQPVTAESIQFPTSAAPLKSQSSTHANTAPLMKSRGTSSPLSTSQPQAPTKSPAYPKSKEELAEVDSIIEEAELYTTYGHPERAALMLQELIPQHPDKNEAWLLLLSILSSLKKGTEFEETARDFLRRNPDSALWPEIQALGRAVEHANPLYGNLSTPDAAPLPAPSAPSKRRLIGDILVEAGVLSMHDMEKCLDDFDPKKHGRLGGYLVARKAVTQEQLQAALLQQQSAESIVQLAPDDVTHDPESFFSGINPQLQDERLDEYLKMDAARNKKLKKT